MTLSVANINDYYLQKRGDYMSNIMQENDIKNMLIKIVDTRVKEIAKPLSPTVIIKCSQSQYETWEINGQIDTNKLYGIILEE